VLHYGKLCRGDIFSTPTFILQWNGNQMPSILFLLDPPPHTKSCRSGPDPTSEKTELDPDPALQYICTAHCVPTFCNEIVYKTYLWTQKLTYVYFIVFAILFYTGSGPNSPELDPTKRSRFEKLLNTQMKPVVALMRIIWGCSVSAHNRKHTLVPAVRVLSPKVGIL
jgi:hypothetical protein